ncbi:MAG TPA: neprosin family prolyl endopeptidase [Thermoanaerobaculia bacterium]|nr:neprosin family prolyl endopeptidase [Thermoanaerobaculia bacterium]
MLLALAFAVATATPAPHQWAAAYQYVENRGGRATFNVWNPYVEQAGEFSLAQLWLLGGTNKGQQTLEAGWHVFPSLYGDNRTHLFIYDGQCYNLACGSFVQTNPAVVLGGPLECTSAVGGAQCEITLEFARSESGDWWLRVNDTPVGYYPASRFDPAGLGRSATAIEAGGEIVNASAPGQTATSMGSGRPPIEGYGRAAYARNIQYIDMGNSYREATSLSTTPPNPYQSVLVNPARDTFWGGGSIFFGGPGRQQAESTLRAASTSTSTVATPSALTIAYTIDSTLPANVIVGAELQGHAIFTDDRRAALTGGANAVVRSFEVPASLASGSYDLTVMMWRDRNGNGVIDSDDALLGTLTYPSSVTVVAPRKRASR